MNMNTGGSTPQDSTGHPHATGEKATADSGTGGDTASQASQEARAAADTLRDQASSVAEDARQAGEARAEHEFDKGSARMASEIGSLGDAMGNAADTLDRQDSPLASYASELASQLASVSQGIEDRSMNEVADDTRRLARENPATFLLGSVAIGIAASRFFKASSGSGQSSAPTSGPRGGNLR